MSASSVKEKTQELSGKVIARLEKEGLSCDPVNFELWFCYYSENHPQITHVIREQEKEKTGFTDQFCSDVYAKYIASAEGEKELVKVAGDRIQNSIEELQEMITSAGQATSSYGSSLKDVTSQMAQANSIEALEVVIRTIATETKKMIDHNHDLEQKIERSSDKISELREDLESVTREALTDGLTGLANRKCFDRELENEINLAECEGHKLCLVIADIDHFKSFNDSYGHQVGDQVLKLVARTLTNGIKGRDLAARYGGEEFCILFPETPLMAAKTVANALRERVAKKDIVNKATNDILGRITISAGAAEYQPGEPIEEFIERADKSLYLAKQNGRNRVEAAHNPYINIHDDV